MQWRKIGRLKNGGRMVIDSMFTLINGMFHQDRLKQTLLKTLFTSQIPQKRMRNFSNVIQ